MTAERAAAFLGLLRAGGTLARELDAELPRDHSIGLRQFEVLRAVSHAWLPTWSSGAW